MTLRTGFFFSNWRIVSQLKETTQMRVLYFGDVSYRMTHRFTGVNDSLWPNRGAGDAVIFHAIGNLS